MYIYSINFGKTFKNKKKYIYKKMEFVPLLDILKKHKKEWINSEDINIEKLTGGISNQIFKVSSKNLGIILIRIYGQKMESLINRTDEINIFKCVSNNNLSPKLLGLFDKGRFEEYIDATPLDEKSIIKFKREIIYKIKKINSMPFNGSLICWDRLFNWNNILISNNSQNYLKDINKLKLKLNEYPNNHIFFRQVFCHNDLLPSNILVDINNQIHVIDFEYAGINYIGLELANHLIYYDFENIKNKQDDIKLFLEEYLNRKVNQLDIELINYFIKITYLTWLLWGEISCNDNNQEIDFDYQNYVEICKKNYYLF